jgi:hypothetical protein
VSKFLVIHRESVRYKNMSSIVTQVCIAWCGPVFSLFYLSYLIADIVWFIDEAGGKLL